MTEMTVKEFKKMDIEAMLEELENFEIEYDETAEDMFNEIEGKIPLSKKVEVVRELLEEHDEIQNLIACSMSKKDKGLKGTLKKFEMIRETLNKLIGVNGDD